jgi:hypothetical protein
MTSLFSHPALRSKEQAHPSHSQAFSLSIQIYVTDRQCSAEEYMSGESPWALAAPPSVHVTIGFGKPCFGQIVESEKATQIGAMAVSVCGPGGMGDDVRQSVRQAQGSKTVDLYEESFTW